MNNELVQSLRYKLQKRTRRLNSTGFQLFHFALKQYWGFLLGNEILASILEELERKNPGAEADAKRIIAGETLAFETELEQVETAYFLIKQCVNSADAIETNVGRSYGRHSKLDDNIEAFRDIFLEPLYDYIDEQLDDQRAVLAQLRRYKHRCEWFRREQLALMWRSDTQRGEKKLASDLYEFLFEQGIAISIEPSSVSGSADLVGAQNGPERLIADAKVFHSETGKGYLIKAFNQIYTYTLDYNEPFGYLVIFKFCQEDLRFPFAAQEQSVPCITHNSKTIFILTVDLCEGHESASKRGPLKTIEITEAELVQKAEARREDVQ